VPTSNISSKRLLANAQRIIVRTRETIRRSREVLRISREVQADRERNGLKALTRHSRGRMGSPSQPLPFVSGGRRSHQSWGIAESACRVRANKYWMASSHKGSSRSREADAWETAV